MVRHQDMKKYSNKKYMSNIQTLEVVIRGSETQLQVGENLSQITLRRKVVLSTIELLAFNCSLHITFNSSDAECFV